jgi:urease accessory protein
MKTSLTAKLRPALALALASLPLPALAHHGMDGEPPSTLLQGLLSGLAHPVIGLDHLSLVLLFGAVCGAAKRGWLPGAAFVGLSLVGCLVHVARLRVPGAELLLAGSIVLAALLALRNQRSAPWTALVAASGLLHGYAYGESMVGAEQTPLLAYLAGFGIVQLTLLWSVQALIKQVDARGAGLGAARVQKGLALASLSIGLVAVVSLLS